MTRDYLLTGETLVRPLHAMAIDVCEKYGITRAQLVGPQRFGALVRARHEFCYLARESGATYRQIGDFLGGRDHSTIINACDRHEGRMWAAQGEANGAA